MCPFCAAVQCAVVDSGGLANVHAISQNARKAPEIRWYMIKDAHNSNAVIGANAF